ncbi:NADPH-dependent aldehyde reductase Ahr [Crateriforma conspicua]|uniref:alcohol dehydrogenase (NADP(+)) n=1 Tax=Crateriforma conspicua TaxID=2527996 RepID=A0A5C5Y4P5_9PLAN|nr:NAD(P)-dependent alcohol dehydrogenase [Crateriforma conspicua]QDV62866.1 Aldehyde reductase Ahr [Crateriforma conspicua]TWT68362.1 Aldehyde reductase Ahr [Crateriforma conspicua]
MPTVHAYAATEAKGELEPFEYELGDLEPDQVDIKVESCGICHSDVSMLDNDWGISAYPLVPGHEVTGTIDAVGESVTYVSPGDRVGLGWHSQYCMTCDQCMQGHHNRCANAVGTIVGHHGGFADRVRAQAAAVTKIPDGLDAAEVGPMLCGGVTVFNPMLTKRLSPTARVGVIGIGGLGHMALMFANAWGCHVTAFTSSGPKMDEAKKLGAHETINSRDDDAIEAAAGQFDMLLSTVNVNLNWSLFLKTLRPDGRLHFLGAVTDPVELDLMPMIFGDLSAGASPVGSPATIRTMLDFAQRHQITPVTEHFPMSKVNDAMEHLREGNARYRIVLDRD